MIFIEKQLEGKILKISMTKTSIDELPITGKRYVAWDQKYANFGIRVGTTGSKSFCIKYRNSSNKSVWYTIGRYPRFTPKTAKDKAQMLFAEIASGKDPHQEKKQLKNAKTVKELCEDYLNNGCGQKKESTLATDRGRITRHINPLLGSMFVKDVTRQDIEKFQRDVAAGKTAADVINAGKRTRSIIRGGKGTASRTIGLLGAIFAYAVRLEIRKDNPVHGVKRPPDKRCDQYLDRSDIVKLRDLLREAEDAGKNPVPINVIRVLLLTGCRKSEILELKWQDIDFDNATLRLHASKNGFRDVQLGSEVLNLFQRISETKINDYVFPSSRNNGHYVGLQKFWERNFQNKGLSKYRIHDLRHTFASIAVKRYNILMVKTMLGHRDIKSTLVYSHVGDKEKREAIEDISNEIYALL